jgi:Protein of unknown function (FYDLN_acid)
VAKPELGNKHQCQNCGARFFDLNKSPIRWAIFIRSILPFPTIKSIGNFHLVDPLRTAGLPPCWAYKGRCAPAAGSMGECPLGRRPAPRRHSAAPQYETSGAAAFSARNEYEPAMVRTKPNRNRRRADRFTPPLANRFSRAGHASIPAKANRRNLAPKW